MSALASPIECSRERFVTFFAHMEPLARAAIAAGIEPPSERSLGTNREAIDIMQRFAHAMSETHGWWRGPEASR